MKRQLLLIVVMLTAILHLQAQMKDKEVSIIPRIGVNMASLKNVYGPVTGAGPAEGTPLVTKMKAGLLIGCDLEMELSRPLMMDIGTMGYRFSLGKVADRRPKSKFYMPASDGNY